MSNQTENKSNNDSSEVLGLDEPTIKYITLRSNDKQEFKVDSKYMLLSKLCKSTLEDDKEATEIDLDVRSKELSAVIDYIVNVRKGKHTVIGFSDTVWDDNYDFEAKENYKTPDYKSPHVINPDLSVQLSNLPDDVKFIENYVKMDDLNHLMLAANYLGISSLLELVNMKIASKIMLTKTHEELEDLLYNL
jgi:hypothetical protein